MRFVSLAFNTQLHNGSLICPDSQGRLCHEATQWVWQAWDKAAVGKAVLCLPQGVCPWTNLDQVVLFCFSHGPFPLDALPAESTLIDASSSSTDSMLWSQARASLAVL